MTRFHKNRLTKLEAKNQPTQRVRRNVVEYDAETGAIIGPVPPKGTKVMLVPNFGDEWEAKLLIHQETLIKSAIKTENERHTP